MNSKKKTLLSAILAIVLCMSLIAGSTFALFTSESKVNIAVTSGKVEVTATVDEESLKLYSATAVNMGSLETAGEITEGAYAGTYYYEVVSPKFTNGGTATFGTNANGEQKLTLDRVTPGDKVTFDIDMLNESNVNIKYRTRVDVVGDNALFGALKITIYNEDAPDTAVAQTKSATISQWKEWLPTDANEKTVKVEIVLPIDADDRYEDKTIELSFAVEAVQGNAAWALLDQINTKLANKAVANATMYDALAYILTPETGANATMYDALAGMTEIALESVIKESGFIWNSETDRFTTESAATGDKVKYFKIYNADEIPAPQTYSIYASNAWATANVDNLTVGFDAGNASGISSVTYDRSAATVEQGQTAIIRTNGGTLTVNAPLDTVKCYGTAATVTIIAVANSSYHEYGTATFVEIAKGRIALESGSNVSQVHIAKVADTETFDEIILAVAPTVSISTASAVSEQTSGKTVITRDDVAIADGGTLVVALQSGTEDITENTELDYVWLTKQGIFEQIKISDSVESATSNAVWADDDKVEEKTQDTAKAIANNIARDADNKINVSVPVDTKEYKVALNEDRDLIVVDSADATQTAVATISTSGTVTVNETEYNVALAANSANHNTELVVTNIDTAEEVGKATAVEDKGLSEDEKTETKNNAIHQDIVDNCNHDYVALNNYWEYENGVYRFFEERICSVCQNKVIHEHELDRMYCTVCEHMIPFVVTTLDLDHENGKVIDPKIETFANSLSEKYKDFYVLGFGDGPVNYDTLHFSDLNYLACFDAGGALELIDVYDNEHADVFSEYYVDFTLEFNVDMDFRSLALAGAYDRMAFAIKPSYMEEPQNLLAAGKEFPVMGSAQRGITYSNLFDVQFLCGLYIDKDIMLEKTPGIVQEFDDATVTLRLVMYETEDDFLSGENRIVVNTLTIPLSTIVDLDAE